MSDAYDSDEDRNDVAFVYPDGFQIDEDDVIYVEEEEEESNKRRRVTNEEECESSQRSHNEIEGLFCPICMDAWTSEGDHHICKWLKQNRSKAKCPQCNRKCTSKDIRKLFAPRLAVVDEESQKTIRALEAKCAVLENKDAGWRKIESEWKKRESDLQLKISHLTQRAAYFEHFLGDTQRTSAMLVTSGDINSDFCSQVSSTCFVLERELLVDGARLFDVNAFNQILLFIRRLPKNGSQVLTKMNLLPPHESEDIILPSCMKIIKDLHVSPFNGSHALCASSGKKLSVFSMENNSVILSYDLPAPAWSCSWDIDSSNYIYAGLQNGSVSVFDVRQTGRVLESRSGLTNNPIHTLHSLQSISSSGGRRLLSASSVGVCQWNFGSAVERPSLIPETADKGVCISLAHCPASDNIVATYRPRVETSNEMLYSQLPLTPPPIIGQGVLGCHSHLTRVDDEFRESGGATATVSNIRLTKSVIIDLGNKKPMFASGDELRCGLILQKLPSFSYVQHLKPHRHLICDVRHKSAPSPGLLGCLSEDALQIFGMKL